MKDCVVTIGSAIWEWGIPEKNQIGGVEDILFEKTLEFLGFLSTPGNSRQNKASPLETPHSCVLHPQKFWELKPRPLEIPPLEILCRF